MIRIRNALAMLTLVGAIGAAEPASAQLTAEHVAAGFVEAVTLCARAKSGGIGVAALPEADRARVAESEPGARAFVRAPAGRPVWDVLAAQGIVFISEPTDTRCDVSAYGPPVAATFDRVAAALTAADLGFTEVETAPVRGSIVRSFRRESDGHTVTVGLDGGEPGMPGRTFRFSMLLAFVGAS